LEWKIPAQVRQAMAMRWLARATFGILLSVAMEPSILAQAGPPCGPNLPIKCAPGKDIAIMSGVAGRLVLLLYVQHRINRGNRQQASITGCTAQANGVMTLTEDNTKTTYLLTPLHKKIKAGERVVLHGKKSQDASQNNVFQVKKLDKDEGPCRTQTPSAGDGDSP
jgi:hypothetical protein